MFECDVSFQPFMNRAYKKVCNPNKKLYIRILETKMFSQLSQPDCNCNKTLQPKIYFKMYCEQAGRSVWLICSLWKILQVKCESLLVLSCILLTSYTNNWPGFSPITNKNYCLTLSASFLKCGVFWNVIVFWPSGPLLTTPQYMEQLIGAPLLPLTC